MKKKKIIYIIPIPTSVSTAPDAIFVVVHPMNLDHKKDGRNESLLPKLSYRRPTHEYSMTIIGFPHAPNPPFRNSSIITVMKFPRGSLGPDLARKMFIGHIFIFLSLFPICFHLSIYLLVCLSVFLCTCSLADWLIDLIRWFGDRKLKENYNTENK